MKTLLPSGRARETVCDDRVATSLSRLRRMIEGEGRWPRWRLLPFGASWPAFTVGTLVAAEARDEIAIATKTSDRVLRSRRTSLGTISPSVISAGGSSLPGSAHEHVGHRSGREKGVVVEVGRDRPASTETLARSSFVRDSRRR